MVVPVGQSATQAPLLRKNPGMHPVHFFWLAVEPALKPEIAHFVHFAPQPKTQICWKRKDNVYNEGTYCRIRACCCPR